MSTRSAASVAIGASQACLARADRSWRFRVAVLDKRFYSGKGPRCKLRLAPWGPDQGGEVHRR
ncbi:hypothetical protein WME91_09605 [Sorangium sp. So ce269]